MSNSFSSNDNTSASQPDASEQMIELQTRLVYMEETVEELNQQIAHLSAEFMLAKQAMQLMNKRVEQLMSNPISEQKGQEPPPPHY